MSWRATLPCSRVQGEAIAETPELFGDRESPPVLVADEPDPTKPDTWLIHAYFDQEPTSEDIATLASLGNGPPQIERLGEEDWVRLSQSGLQPIRAGRFHVHTPTCPPDPTRHNFEIDAGLAFGTGQHATTAGCLEVLDKLERHGASFANIADIGTGTGLLAFAALALWPDAKCIATDIDPIAVEVARDNAAINGIALGHGTGQLLLAQANGMDMPLLSARAPFDLIIANILAGPLVELARDFSKALGKGRTIVLAGLLDTQVDMVARAYEQHRVMLAGRYGSDWPVLTLQRSGTD